MEESTQNKATALPSVSTDYFHSIPEGYTLISEEELEDIRYNNTRNGYLEGYGKGYDRGYEDGIESDNVGWSFD